MSVKNMNAGNGANNSASQKVVITKTWPALDDTLKDMLDDTLKDMLTSDAYEFTKCMKIADLGCSSGPNTLLVISYIIEQLSKQEHAPCEIQVFLNDLPDNDFNNLFKLMTTNTNTGLEKNNKENICIATTSLPQVFEAYSNQFERDFTTFLKLRGEEIRGGGRMVSGFIGRSVADPTSKDELKALTLLSETLSDMVAEIPQGLEKNNKENIYIVTTSPPQVFEAYSKQFERDFTTFLKLRGEEIRVSGRMVLGFLGRSVADPTSKDEFKSYTFLLETLSDMVSERLVKEEDLHSFNIPIYGSSVQEIEAEVESEGSFNLDKMEFVFVPWNAKEDCNDYEKTNTSGKILAKCVRAFLEPMLVVHFGSSVNVDHVFDVYAEKVEEHLSVERSSYFFHVISLTRKTTT